MGSRDARPWATGASRHQHQSPDRSRGGPGPRDPAGTDHVLQLFDDSASAVDAVAEYLLDGLRAGETALVVVRARHREAITARLAARGHDALAAGASERLLVIEAEDVLPRLLREGWPDAAKFDAHFAAPLRALAAGASGVRVYGELVDVLAEQGDFDAAERLEQLWNDLRTEVRCRLLCGYSSVCFGAPSSASTLARLCRLHTRAAAGPGDVLGSFLLARAVDSA